MVYEISKEKGISDYFYCKKFILEKHPPRIHSHFEIIFVQSGVLDVVISGKSYAVQAGEMIFIMPYDLKFPAQSSQKYIVQLYLILSKIILMMISRKRHWFTVLFLSLSGIVS